MTCDLLLQYTFETNNTGTTPEYWLLNIEYTVINITDTVAVYPCNNSATT